MNIKVLPTKKKPSEINIIVCNAVDYTTFMFLYTYIIYYILHGGHYSQDHWVLKMIPWHQLEKLQIQTQFHLI